MNIINELVKANNELIEIINSLDILKIENKVNFRDFLAVNPEVLKSLSKFKNIIISEEYGETAIIIDTIHLGFTNYNYFRLLKIEMKVFMTQFYNQYEIINPLTPEEVNILKLLPGNVGVDYSHIFNCFNINFAYPEKEFDISVLSYPEIGNYKSILRDIKNNMKIVNSKKLLTDDDSYVYDIEYNNNIYFINSKKIEEEDKESIAIDIFKKILANYLKFTK